MEELLKKMQKSRESYYLSYRGAELTESEIQLAYIEGVLVGMDIMIDFIKEALESEYKGKN